jgi:hypothetical protein
VLLRAGADRASVILSTIRRPEDNRTLLRIAGKRPVLVRVFDPLDADWIRDMGGRPILYSDAAADEFLRWFSTRFRARSE